MNAEQAQDIVEILLKRQLTALEQLILVQSWQGVGYHDMAQNSGYGSNYFKEVGSQLWHCLSEAVEKKVTKKNLHLTLKEYRLNGINSDNTQTFPLFTDSKVITATNTNYNYSFTKETEIKYPGSPLPYNSPFYINRPLAQKLVLEEIHQPGCLIRIKAPKQMGKSSLLNWVVAHAKTSGYQTVYIDLQEADDTVFISLDKFLRWFASNVSRQLNLIPKLDDYWDEDIGSKVSCKMYFEGYLLEPLDNPLVLVFNELNRVFEYPKIVNDFLSMLRFWHEMSQQVEIWQKLRLVMAHSAENYVKLNINQSPFNVGIIIGLLPFTLEQVQNLAQLYGLDWAACQTATRSLEPLQAMVGGHPYLTALALYHLCQEKMTLDTLLQLAPTHTGIYGQHLRELLSLLLADLHLMFAMQQVVMASERVELNAIAAYKLESMGLVQLDGNRACTSCKLYQLYFRQQLEKQNLASALLSY